MPGKTRSPRAGQWPVSYRLLATGALAVYTVIGVKTFGKLHAQQPALPIVFSAASEQVTAAGSVHRFDIASGPLEAVMTSFRETAGLRVEWATEAIRTLNSPGVSGVFTTREALEKLLAGTGVSARFTSPQTALLELRGPNTTVEVEDRVASLSSTKYTEPLRNTPQSIMVIPKSVIEEQGAMTLRDVLRNVPGLTVVAGEGGAPAGDNLTLRGFSARNDIFIDGARDLGAQSRDPFNTEQVEVVKGPTSAFSGRGSAGGVINMVSKSPNLQRLVGGTVNFGSDGTRRLGADLNVPLARLGMGERTAFRLNLLSHDSGVAGRDAAENNRWGVAPSLAFGLGTPSRLTLSYYKLKQNNIPDFGIPWVPATNNALADFRDQAAPVPRETYYGLKNRDFERMGSDLATVRYEYDFSDNLNLRSQLRYGRSTRDSLATPPRFASNDSTTITRDTRSWITRDANWDSQTDFKANFKTGAIEHSVVTGFALSHENNIRQTRTTNILSTTTLLNPDFNEAYAGQAIVGPNTGDVTGKTQAVYAFDTVKLGKKLEATGGLRWERFDVDGVNTTPAPIARVDRMNSVRAGLVYKPVEKGSFYASYGTSLSPSLEGLTYGVANTSIAPERTYTLEAGTKWDVASDRLMLSAAAFRVDKDNARTPGVLPGDPPQVLDGRQRVNGLELAATGAISQRVKVLAAYTLMDARIASSNTPAEVGKFFQNTPRNSFSLWSTFQLRKLTVGGGPRVVGRRFGNNTNTRRVEAYWTFDGLASYPINKFMDLRLNIYNLNNEYFFDRLGGGHLVPGASRSVNGSVFFRF